VHSRIDDLLMAFIDGDGKRLNQSPKNGGNKT
jgi:hypothetical protein